MTPTHGDRSAWPMISHWGRRGADRLTMAWVVDEAPAIEAPFGSAQPQPVSGDRSLGLLEHTGRPAGLVLTRQNLPTLQRGPGV